MSRGILRRALASATIILALEETGAAKTRGRANVIIMKYHQFKPSVLEVSEGTTVIWLNEDRDPHMVVSGAVEGKVEGALFSSERLLEGWSFSHAFPDAGEFSFHCPFHPEMKGKIVVHHA